MDLGATLFNSMIKTFQAKGLHLWNQEEIYIFLDKSQPDYTLGNQASSPSKACYRSDAVITTLSADAAIAATSLTVSTSSNMTIGDYIGIVLNDNTIQWTTIATIPTSTSVTITAALTGATSSNRNVYAFTTLIDKPLRISSVRRISFASSISEQALPMQILSHEEYYELPYKRMTGTPTHWYYQPRKTYGEIHMWPATDTAMTYIEATMERGLADLDAGTDIPDFPDEWIEVLTWQLAIRLAVPFGREDKVAKLIIPLGAELMQGIDDWDSEVVSVSFQPQFYRS